MQSDANLFTPLSKELKTNHRHRTGDVLSAYTPQNLGNQPWSKLPTNGDKSETKTRGGRAGKRGLRVTRARLSVHTALEARARWSLLVYLICSAKAPHAKDKARRLTGNKLSLNLARLASGGHRSCVRMKVANFVSLPTKAQMAV